MNGNKIYIIGFGVIIAIVGIVFTYLFSCYNRTEAKVDKYGDSMTQYQEANTTILVKIGVIEERVNNIQKLLERQFNIKTP